MGNWRTERPVENGSFPDDSVDWMDTPEGQQSIEALDLVFGALDHVDVDARQRKIVWTDGKRLSIEESAERLHAEHPGMPRDLIETHVFGWLENCAPGSTPTNRWRNSTGSWSRGSKTTSASDGPSESSQELGTLQKYVWLGPISLGMKQMGARSAGNPHAACDVEGAGNVAGPNRSARSARQSSTLPERARG